jgi:hypothetical protein
MVSLLISKLGKVISGCTPDATYDVLKARGFLSETGLADPRTVVLLVKGVLDSWPVMPRPGDEPWRNIQAALEEGGFLSTAGLAAAREYVSRR